MKGTYFLIGFLAFYMLIDTIPYDDNGITKKKMFDIASWDNSTINNVVINRENDIALLNVDFFDYRWKNKYNTSNYCDTEELLNNDCIKIKEIIETKNYKILLEKNHNFGNNLKENKHLEDTEILYVNTPKPNIVFELFNKVIYYLLLFIIAKTVISSAVGALVTGVSQATDTGSPFRIIKGNDKAEHVKTKLNDIAGYEDTKKEVQEYIAYLKSRERYIKMGAKLPRGLLLIGKPGSGKTLLAKAIAGESGVSFIHCSGSDFNDRFIGMGSNRVGQLFKLARENSPSIIFIDEIDSIGASRDNYSSGVSHEHNVTLNKLLVEMDGFSDNENILIIASTNRHDSLDDALTRSGRFDRKIVIDLPNVSEREGIFKLYLERVTLENKLKIDEFSKKMAKKTSGVSGADINNICNQAAILAVREEKEVVEWNHLERAIDDIIIGIEKRSRMMTENERNIVAHHEAGHALLGYLLKDCSPPIKVSIIPRGVGALGFSQQEPEEKKLYNKEELLSKISVLFGGRAAEDVMFDKITTGASDDIERATELIYSMITTYGLSNKIGLLNYNKSRRYNIGQNKLNDIETEMTEITDEIYKWTSKIIEIHKEKIIKLAESLLKNEILLGEDIESLIDEDKNLINSLDIIKLIER
jgi:ATP-dependent metalloprotease FtsH